MDFDSLQDDNAAPAQQPAVNQPAQPSYQPQNFDSLQDDSEKYGTPEQMAGTALEGVAQGVAGPLATYAETNLLGIPAQDIAGRAATNPWTHGLSEAAGLIGGAVSGVGEAAGAANIAKAVVPEATTLAGKIGAGALKGFIEGGLIQGSDEVSNAMLGQGDPEAPVSTALAHMGAAGLFGGVAGGLMGGTASKLKAIGDSKMGTAIRQGLEDFGNRWKFNVANPDLNESVINELKDFHNSTVQASSDLWSGGGLRQQAIDKLSQAVTPEQLEQHINDVQDMIKNAPKALQGDPLFNDAVQAWRDSVTPKVTSAGTAGSVNSAEFLGSTQAQYKTDAGDVFRATDLLKRQLGEWANPRTNYVPLSDRPFTYGAKGLAAGLRASLEDTGTWGDLGSLQKQVNGATSKFIAPFQDFQNTFTKLTKTDGRVFNPGAVNTYVNQLGQASAEIKQGFVKNLVESAEKYRSTINDVHAQFGLDSPLQPASLNAVKGTYGATTAGGDMADFMFRKGIPSITDPLAEKGAATALGAHLGGAPGALGGFLLSSQLSPFIEGIIGRPIQKGVQNYVVPALLKAMSSETANGFYSLLDHANAAGKGLQSMNSGVENLFKTGTQQGVNALGTDENREKIKEFIQKGGISQQVTPQATQQPANAGPQHFAEGGEVTNQFQPQDAVPQAAPGSLFQGTHALSTALPAQNMMMNAAKSRVSNYLNSIAPQQTQIKLPFDKNIEDSESGRVYNRAINLANEPLSILNHVKEGTLTPETLKHFTGMYPEIYSQLSKKMTEHISKAQIEGEVPSYRVRQGMSLFLGTPLDSTMTPKAMQSIQAVYSQKRAQQQPMPQSKPQKNTSKLGSISKDHYTQSQATDGRATQWD